MTYYIKDFSLFLTRVRESFPFTNNKFSLILILYAPSYNIYVRLNLINHFIGFILCQFAYNSTFRNPVFWWESCKGSMWESVKKSSKVCNSVGPYDWISRLARSWQVAKRGTCVKHAEELKSHTSYCTIGQKSQAG